MVVVSFRRLQRRSPPPPFAAFFRLFREVLYLLRHGCDYFFTLIIHREYSFSNGYILVLVEELFVFKIVCAIFRVDDLFPLSSQSGIQCNVSPSIVRLIENVWFLVQSIFGHQSDQGIEGASSEHDK